MFPNPLRISYVNHADVAVLSGLVAVTSLPLSNLKDDDIKKVFRGTASSASGPVVINADLTSIRTIGCVAFINCNFFTPPCTLRLRMSPTDPAGLTNLVYDSLNLTAVTDPLPGHNTFVHFIEPQVSARYVRININDIPTPPEAGRLLIGEIWAPLHDMRAGFEPVWRDFSVRSRSLGGNEFTDVRPRQRGYRFTILALTEDEAQNQVDHLNRTRGIGRDILVCRNKNSDNLGRDTIWGLLEQPVTQRKTRSGYEIEVEVWARV